MKRLSNYSLKCTIALLFGLASGHLSTACLADQPDLKIGVMLCLSGDCAEWGTNGLKGIELAIEQLNQRGGILGRTVQAVVEDSQDNIPSRAVSAFRRLNVDSDINFMVGPTWTVGAMPIAPLIAADKNIVVISPSVGVKEFNEASRNILNTWPHDEKATRELARYAIAQGWRKAAIFGSQDPFVKVQSDTFNEEFTKLGGSISVRVEPLPSSRELKAEALRIRASNPDVIFFSNYQVDVFARELQQIRCTVPKLSILMEKERVKSAQSALEGTVFALYEDPSAAFKEAFQQKFNKSPGITADTAYDAVMLFAKAIEAAGSVNVNRVNQELHATRNYKGAAGTFSVDAHGAVDKAPVLWTVRGLEYVRNDQL